MTAAAKQRGLPFPGRMAGCNVKHPCRSFQKRSETKTRFGNADGTSSNQSLFILPQYASWPDNLGDYLSLNGLDACQETTLVNANVSSDRTVNGCSVEVSYSTVKSGKKLTINHEISTELGLGFSMEPGSELEIR